MADTKGSWSAVWDQFLSGKKKLLADYGRAKERSKDLPVATHHGVVGEAELRVWLESFLPKRYGVTSGYIRSQSLRDQNDNAHFDVIVYNQLDSPILWIEENSDKSVTGRARIIPAEYVHAVLEVKATFSKASVARASEKLRQLQPLMAGVDPPAERYPRYLPRNFATAIVFYELLSKNAHEVEALEEIKELGVALNRPFYGAVILSGESRPQNESARIALTESNAPLSAFAGTDLLSGFYMSATPASPPFIGTHQVWSPLAFADFAFDLLALIAGTYQQGRVSSFHGFDLSKVGSKDDK